jgi:hypothetical protein
MQTIRITNTGIHRLVKIHLQRNNYVGLILGFELLNATLQIHDITAIIKWLWKINWKMYGIKSLGPI